MAPREATQAVMTHGSPGREFWENELEIGFELVLHQATQDGFMDEWIEKRSGRQVEILRQNLGFNGTASIQQRKEQLRSGNGQLLPYVLVQEFAKRKSKAAMVDFARAVLSPDTLEACRVGGDDYDTLALCFAIYHQDHAELRPILHLDKIHKSGFARMRLRENLRRPDQPPADFLTPETVIRILEEFDQSQDDGRISEFKNVIRGDAEHQLVFIRRCERPSLILRGRRAVHGYRPEWIVLDFFDGAKRLNISSLSVADSLEIANRIASEYFGTPCEYENESDITYAAQIERFLNWLATEEKDELPLVEVRVSNSPLSGAPAMALWHPQSQSLRACLAHFAEAVGSLLAAIDCVATIKVCFHGKRVSLIFEKVDSAHDGYTVRYSDHRLNPLERLSFEGYMRKHHGIPVLSTEKRFKAKPRPR